MSKNSASFDGHRDVVRPEWIDDNGHLNMGYYVVAFDLAGAEYGHPARDHLAAFEYALGRDLACTCHSGEGDGPDSIREAVHICGAHRVGHGTRLFEDPDLEAELIDRGVPLEVCLTSNLH